MELTFGSDQVPILTNLVDCLALYPHDVWMEAEGHLGLLSTTQPRIQALQRFLVSGAVEAPLDAQGRILIPPHLREHARLDREVTLAGVGPRIEIWDRARFDEDLAFTRTHFDEFSSALRPTDSTNQTNAPGGSGEDSSSG